MPDLHDLRGKQWIREMDSRAFVPRPREQRALGTRLRGWSARLKTKIPSTSHVHEDWSIRKS